MSLSDIGPCEHHVKSSQYVLPWQHVKNDEPVNATCSCVAVHPVHLVVALFPTSHNDNDNVHSFSRCCVTTGWRSSCFPPHTLTASVNHCFRRLPTLPAHRTTKNGTHSKTMKNRPVFKNTWETTGYLPLPLDDPTPLHVGLTCMAGLDGLLSASQPQRRSGRKAQSTPKCRDEREGRGRGRRGAGLS